VQKNREMADIGRKTAIIFLCGAALAGCSIKYDDPSFKYPSRTNYTDQNWPKLAVTQELLALGDESSTQAGAAELDAARLTARAARLRAHARAL